MTADVVETLMIPGRLARLSLRQFQTFTSGDQWNGFSLDVFHFPAMQFPATKSSRYTLLFNAGAPLFFYTEADGDRRKYKSEKGFIVRLSSPCEMKALRLESELKAMQLTIEPRLLNEIADTSCCCLDEHLNLSDPFLADIFFRIIDTITYSHLSERIYLETLVQVICLHLISNYSSTKKKVFAPKGKLSAAQLSRVTEFTHRNIHLNISLAEMASYANLSAYHFARLFRHTTSISPYQFVLQMKIEHSKNIILQHNGSISDVAYLLNFTDQAHFSNAFKKITGVSPRQFLRDNEM